MLPASPISLLILLVFLALSLPQTSRRSPTSPAHLKGSELPYRVESAHTLFVHSVTVAPPACPLLRPDADGRSRSVFHPEVNQHLFCLADFQKEVISSGPLQNVPAL